MSSFARPLRTPRLDLVPASLAHLDAELLSPEALASRLGAVVPEGWPPGQHDLDAVRFFRERLVTEGDASIGHYGWYASLHAGDAAPSTVIGTGGFFGPPSEGAVEIGYSVVESFRGRGLASEMMRALLDHAFAHGVTRVIAHTTADNVGSGRVLERLGFSLEGDGAEPGTIRFARSSPATRL